MSVWGDIMRRAEGASVRKEDDIKSSIVIEDKNRILSDEEMSLLHKSLLRDFNLGDFHSLEEVLDELKVHVIIDPREPCYKDEKNIPSELEKAKAFWEEKVKKNPNDVFARKMEREVREEIEKWRSQIILGLYRPAEKEIKLFPNNMKKKYDGTKMKESLVSTLVHEAMHAYFDRVPLNDLPYVYSLEEPMAEFGMLLYLKETGQSVYYEWAMEVVGAKRNCYRYGVALMEQCDREGVPSQTRKDLELFKVIWPTFSFIMKPSVSMTTGKSSPKYEVIEKRTRKVLTSGNAMTKIVLFIVRDYCFNHPGVTLADLQKIFAGIHHSYKGMSIIESSKSVGDYKKSHPGDSKSRYMENDSITLTGGEIILVSNEWAEKGDKENFSRFKTVADSLGYEIR